MTLDLRQSLSVTRVLLTWHQYPHLFIFVTSISTYICWDMILDLSQSPSVTRVLLILIHKTSICPYLCSACAPEYFQWHKYQYLWHQYLHIFVLYLLRHGSGSEPVSLCHQSSSPSHSSSFPPTKSLKIQDANGKIILFAINLQRK